MRPGMYIGKLGDGKDADDGIYVLLKEVVDNSVDEYTMGNGKSIEVGIRDGEVRVRDYGRGIPLGKVIDCVSKINTGGKYDSRAFKKTVGLNGVGTKAVNALSEMFKVESYRAASVRARPSVLGRLPKIETRRRPRVATVLKSLSDLMKVFSKDTSTGWSMWKSFSGITCI